MTFVTYALAPPVWQKRGLILLTLVALAALGVTAMIFSLKAMLALLISLAAYAAWRRFAHYPIELLVSTQGVACRLPQTLTQSSSAAMWQRPILSLNYLAVPSPRGWWLITRENLSKDAMQAIRRQCFHG